MNSESVVHLLKMIAEKYPKRPITLVLDNARYQRNKYVQAEAAKLQMDLLFLPPYSLNLNLVERLWKFVKSDELYGEYWWCLNSRYYETFPDFCKAIETCFAHTKTKHKSRLDTLLTLKFQQFKKPA